MGTRKNGFSRSAGTPRPSRTWGAACDYLIQNVLDQDYVPSDGGAVSAPVNGHAIVLPSYIPYIGLSYFEHRPRVLCYAINQNLSRHRRWTDDWVTQWAQDKTKAIDRLNQAAREGKALPIKPYAEGFIPLVAMIALMRSGASILKAAGAFVDDVIAVTNFVTFSTAGDASSSSIPRSWWSECARRYVAEEIRALAPDILIGFGNRTAGELKRVVSRLHPNGDGPELLACRFPARIPSRRSYRLSPSERGVWERDILPLANRIKAPPEDSYHRWRIEDFPRYFLHAKRAWDAFT